ncbi:DinB family protein [uncultured Algibacter sp.]|uniref:DinB family protein n=1 Tax=uncultured Algibacter sp. TaxID=298659 RepID=UPI002621A264|nr:DinB family protein [uncultured Algibacter sp.]
MKVLEHKLQQLLQKGCMCILEYSDSELLFKASPDKWSKKEILGHLIDSGINNLQRFTEIQFKEKPYSFESYSQNELVKANGYQNASIKELLDFWKSINNRILYLFSIQNEETLSFKIILDTGDSFDLRFLMEDYVSHLEYHLNQIFA